ncbi:hypothetical protein [Mycobacterium sp. EPa45]|uniref:hypothetical protein n=1 Tax=Mycobacterium sp. EPa45 TaxID=1545728 RepID=UPI0011874D05|nr:hypothetical protein [Mycobacterium sp. EPa45]
MNTRHAVWLGALTAGFGMALAFGAGTASADDGTGSPARGTAASDTTVASEGAPRIDTTKAVDPASVKLGSAPTAGLGNGRMTSSFGSSVGVYSSFGPSAAGFQTEAEEIEQSTKYLEADQNRDEAIVDAMGDDLDEIRSAMAAMPAAEQLSPRSES